MGRTKFTTARSPGTNSGNMPTCPMRWRRKTWLGARPRFVPPVRAELVEAPFFSGNEGQEDENGPSTSSGRADVGGCLLIAAGLFEAVQPVRIEEVAIVKPRPHEVLTRTAAVGVCRSALPFFHGAY